MPEPDSEMIFGNSLKEVYENMSNAAGASSKNATNYSLIKEYLKKKHLDVFNKFFSSALPLLEKDNIKYKCFLNVDNDLNSGFYILLDNQRGDFLKMDITEQGYRFENNGTHLGNTPIKQWPLNIFICWVYENLVKI